MWKEKAIQMSFEGFNAREISNKLDVDYEKVRQYIKKQRRKLGRSRDCGGHEPDEVKQNKEDFEFVNGESTYTIEREIINGQEITPELIMQAKGLKVEDWDVISFKQNVWQQQTKDGNTKDLCQSKLTVRPKKQKELSLEDIDNYLATKTFKNTKSYPKYEPNSGHKVLEIDVADLHFGLLSWSHETGQNFDLDICRENFLNAITEIVSKAKHKDLKDIYFCTLGDILHIDNDENKTTKGTLQQADGRLPKIFDKAIDMLQEALEMLMETKAQIHYIYTCGNHDRNTGYFLIKCLELANKENPNITFDIRPNPMKAIHFGKVLVGLSHGDISKKNKGQWLFNDYREWFGESKFVEEHCGHIHEETTNKINGIKVRSVMAQTGASYWEHQQGYRGEKGIQSFVWDIEKGLEEIWYG